LKLLRSRNILIKRFNQISYQIRIIINQKKNFAIFKYKKMNKKVGKRESSTKKKKIHTKVNDNTLNSENIKGLFKRIDKNEEQILCIPCTESNKRKGSIRDAVIYYENLENHLETMMHKLSIESKRTEGSQNREETKKPETEKNKKVRENTSLISDYRFHITGFLIKNNLPFKLAPKLDSFMKKLLDSFPQKELASFNVTREDASEIAGDHIGGVLKNKILTDLENWFYYISVD